MLSVIFRRSLTIPKFLQQAVRSAQGGLSFTALAQKQISQYSKCKESQTINSSDFLKSYTQQKDSSERKLSRKDYTTFKCNLNSLDSVDVLVQYLQPTKIHNLSQKQIRRALKLILIAEKQLLANVGQTLEMTKKQLLDQTQLPESQKAMEEYLSLSKTSREFLSSSSPLPESINKFFVLKETICKAQIRKMRLQKVLLKSFKTLTYLSIPAALYAVPYTSLLFLHPYVGGTFYLFALLSLRQNQIMGIFISLLLGGSLSYAFYRTYSDINSLYLNHFQRSSIQA